jgi:hypothetical protein
MLMPNRDKVCIAYVHSLEVAHSWHQSLMALIAYDVANSQRVIGGGWLATKYGTGGIVQARNDTTRQFVHDMPDVDWLMWVDTDMGFEANAVDRLMDAADPETAPIMGGLCFMNREVGVDGVGGYLVQPAPTIFDWYDDGERRGFTVRRDYERDSVLACAGTGSAFVLIHKSVFQRIESEYGQAWYSPVRNPTTDSWISEDLSMCARANALEIPVHVHTGVKTTHLKHMWLDERLFDRMATVD